MANHAINDSQRQEINRLYIELVGPIGELLIDDAEALMHKHQWQGERGIQSYIRFLAENIQCPTARNTFLSASGQTPAADHADQKTVSLFHKRHG